MDIISFKVGSSHKTESVKGHSAQIIRISAISCMPCEMERREVKELELLHPQVGFYSIHQSQIVTCF